jgi:hypothetical protein
MADLGPAILSAASGLAGALIGALVTLTVQRRSLDLQQRSIEVQRGTLELQQAQTARAAERRWDDTRRSVYPSFVRQARTWTSGRSATADPASRARES